MREPCFPQQVESCTGMKKRTESLAHRCRLQLPQTLRKVPSDTILKQYEGYVKGNTPQRLFSMDDYDDAVTGSPDMDGSAPKFKNWDEAFWHFENLAGSNLAFADLPVMTSEMEFGTLDSHGKWYETLGTYSKDAAGLAKFNEDVKDFLSTYEISDEELNELFHEIYNAGAEDAVAYEWGQRTNSFEWTMEWLQKPAGEEDKHEDD